MQRTVGLALWLCLIQTAAALASSCGDKATQTDMNICAGKAYRAADALLNTRYNKIIGCLKGSAGALVEAQRAWLTFRDAECKFQGSASAGGSIQPFVVAECLEAVTQARATALDYYLTCKEGDASCPTWQCRFK